MTKSEEGYSSPSAKTASVGDLDMVTLLPSDSSSSSSSLLDAKEGVQAMQQSSVDNDRDYDGTTTTTTRGDEQQQPQQQQQRQQQLSDTLDSLAAMTNLCDPSVMDDDAFNASLDELLRDANCYDALATTTTTKVGTVIGGLIGGIGVVDNNAYDPIAAMMTGGTGGGGRKRKFKASLPVASTSLTTTLPQPAPTTRQSRYHSLTTDKPSSSRSLTCLMSNHHHQQHQQQQRSWGGPTIRGQSAINFSTTTNNAFPPPLVPPSFNNNTLSRLNDTWQTTHGARNVVHGPLLQCGVNTVLPEQQFQTTVGPTAHPTIIPQSCQSLDNNSYSGIETRMMSGAPLQPQQQQQPCSEVDEPESRQSERNRREQERSHKITERITELRSVLSEAGVNFKPDRYSTLVSVANYVKALQVRSACLDEEHKKLLDSVEKTEDGVGADVKQQQTTRDLDDTMTASAVAAATTTTFVNSSDDELLKFVHGIDYRKIFINSAIALAIASVDGRFVDCNDEFLHLTDYTREELLGAGQRRNSVLPHPQDSTLPPSEFSATNMMSTTMKTGIHARSLDAPALTVSTTTVTASELKDATTTTTQKMGSKESRFVVVGDLEGDTVRPPPEIRVRKRQHLSLFNLLGGEDMETVYAAMSRMLRAPEEMSHVAKSSFDPLESSGTDSGGGGTSSSTEDSIGKSDFTRSSEADESSSGMEVSNGEDAGGAADENNMNDVSSKNTAGDHWTGRVKHTRRKDHVVSVNSSLYLSKVFQREMFTNLYVHAFLSTASVEYLARPGHGW
jgi:PAS domain-containing protein